MNDARIQKRYSILGWFFSLLLHFILGTMFIIITVDMTPITPEFAELTISRFVAMDSPEISRDQPQTAPTPARQSTAPQKESRLVEIPKRRMLDTEEEKIPLDIKDKVQVQENVRSLTTRIDPLKDVGRETQATRESVLPGERQQPGTRTIDVGQKIISPTPSEGIVGEIKLKKPYEISWEGGAREVLAEKLPTFPEDVNKEVVLVFHIEVLPDGTVGEIDLLKKGEATLESVTRQALKQWLFNPLEKSAPQESQFGVITFRFILK